MKRTIYALILVAVLGWFATPALAVNPVATRLHGSFDWLEMAAGTTKYLPPGSITDTTQVVVGKPYAGFWLFGVADSFGATPTIAVVVDYRCRVRYPGTNSYYWTPWTGPLMYLTVPDTLYYSTVWGNDTLGWFDDVQFQARDSGTNDSSQVRLWVVKRYRR